MTFSKARALTFELAQNIKMHTGVDVSFGQAQILRRAEKTLHRWHEQECGDGNKYASWAIERDEWTGIPYRVTYPHKGASYRTPIRDMERGALRRIDVLCKTLGLNYFVQTDPRGCALYIGHGTQLTDTNYTNGVAVQ